MYLRCVVIKCWIVIYIYILLLIKKNMYISVETLKILKITQ